MKGGYVLIDCTGLDLIKGETPQTVNGLYAKVTKAVATGKMMIAENCNWDGKAVSPIQLFAIDMSGTWYCTASTLQIRVASNDSVTIINMGN